MPEIGSNVIVVRLGTHFLAQYEGSVKGSANLHYVRVGGVLFTVTVDELHSNTPSTWDQCIWKPEGLKHGNARN